MAIGLGTLAKIARGGMSLDDIRELLEQMGVKMDFARIQGVTAETAFTDVARASLGDGSQTFQVVGRMKTGEQVKAVITLIPSPEKAKITSPPLDAAIAVE